MFLKNNNNNNSVITTCNCVEQFKVMKPLHEHVVQDTHTHTYIHNSGKTIETNKKSISGLHFQ